MEEITQVVMSPDASFVTFEEIKQYYEQQKCWGLAAGLDLKQCNPDKIRSTVVIEDYVLKLCNLIKMKRFQATKIVHFGEDEHVAGYSMLQLIETSLISGHFANITNSAYIDIFSCKLYNPYLAAEFTKQFFEAKSAQIHLAFRV